jgi:hypothetical protein
MGQIILEILVLRGVGPRVGITPGDGFVLPAGPAILQAALLLAAINVPEQVPKGQVNRLGDGMGYSAGDVLTQLPAQGVERAPQAFQALGQGERGQGRWRRVIERVEGRHGVVLGNDGEGDG